MITYQYKARDKFGKPVGGLMSGESESAVAAKLQEMGYVPISIGETKAGGSLGELLDKFMKKVSSADLNMFTKQFAALQKAGIPLLLTLRTLKEEVSNKNFKDTLEEITRDIEGGATLSGALAKYPAFFNPLYVNMVKTGEASGTLYQSLERLAELGEYEEKIRLRIKAATRYPLFVVIALVAGFLILTTLVVPRFAKIFAQFTTALPLPTQILLWLNLAVTRYWWLCLIFIGALIFGFNKFINTQAGRLQWDNFKLKVPVFGPLVLKLAMARFTRITGTLMKSGVGLFEILDLVSGGVGNVIIARTIENIKKSVSEGKGISEPMRSSGMFTPIVVQMVSVGEQTGRLDELLLFVSEYYETQAEYTVDNLTSLIEPILIFVLGCAVLFMALGIFLPMWNLMSLFRK